jgi:hypothetical protein
VARTVIDSLGLRLVPAFGEVVRSTLVRDVWVSPQAPDGPYELVYDDQGRTAEFRDGEGTTLGSAPVGALLDAGIVRFVPQPPPGESRVYGMNIVPASSQVGRITGSISATPRESTSIIDASFTGEDPVLAPRVLNVAAQALREVLLQPVLEFLAELLLFLGIFEVHDTTDHVVLSQFINWHTGTL